MTAVRDPGAPLSEMNALAASELPFTPSDFRRIAALLHGVAGIYLPQSKAALVYSRLAKRLRALGLRSFREYCALVEGDGGADEQQRMLAALTTNVTRFFREPHHFEHLKAVAPALIEHARRGGRVRLWSAGCASGEEAYSIALTLLDLAPDASRLDVKILASDLNTEVLELGRTGVYSRTALEPVPLVALQRWFEPVVVSEGGDRAWRVGDDLRELVTFRCLNLFSDWPMRGLFDAVFCRNVMIYFDEAAQARLAERFAAILQPGGRLYVGHSERLSDPAGLFETEALTTYRLAARA
jgi:chemotaxis protein methyltransferase CheR